VRDNPVQDDKDKQIESVQRQMLQAESQAQNHLLLEYKRAHSKIDINKQEDVERDL
jgi:hypothetical protein